MKEDISKHLESSLPFIEQYVETDVLLESSSQHTSYYSYNNQLRYDSSKIKGFKYLDTYRLGVQFKNSHGIWSPVVYISDYKIKTLLNILRYLMMVRMRLEIAYVRIL